MGVTGDFDRAAAGASLPRCPRQVQLLPFHYLKVGNAEVEIRTLNSAVHLENLSGDIAGCRGGEEDQRGGDLPRVTDPAKRSRLLHLRSRSSVSTMSSAEVTAAPTAIPLTRI